MTPALSPSQTLRLRALRTASGKRSVCAPFLPLRWSVPHVSIGQERSDAEPRRQSNAFGGRLAALSVGRERYDVDGFSDLAVLVLVFTDPVALAAPTAEGRPFVTQAVQLISKLIERKDMGYLRLSRTSGTVASGFDGNPVRAARHIGKFALHVQESLTDLFVETDQRSAFRIGLAMGSAVGAIVEEESFGFDAWSKAVDATRALAGSAAEGMIQTSGQIHVLCTDDFLVQRRGRFWLEGSGETATDFLMARA